MTVRQSITAIFAATVLTTGLGGDALGGTGGTQHLVEFGAKTTPENVAARIAALGGDVIEMFPELRVALVSNLTDGSAAALAAQPGIRDVTLDVYFPPNSAGGVRGAVRRIDGVSSAPDPTAAFAYPYQWNMRAIEADRAWAAGYLGSPDVRIAVLDSGIDPVNPDFVDLIDVGRSISFCPEEDELIAQEFPGYPAWTDLVGHGTWVASMAASSGTIMAGVTSRSTLMVVKRSGLLGCHASGTFRAIHFAATHGADVINMSFRVAEYSLPREGQKGLFHYFALAIRSALKNGVSAVVVAAGNDAVDFDHGGYGFPGFCDIRGVICVAATGPTDFGPEALGPWIDTDAPAFFTNFGVSSIDVAAPGGNLSFDEMGNLVGVGVLFGACASTQRQFDAEGNIVPGACPSGGYLFRDDLGTSGSAAHVSGLAALLVSQVGHGKPGRVRSTILKSADDLGEPGRDPLYGRGRINVARALGIR